MYSGLEKRRLVAVITETRSRPAARQNGQVPEPGWYSDPLDPTMVRLWTGTGWTEMVKEGPDYHPPGATPKAPAVVGAAVSVLLPDVCTGAGVLAALVGSRLAWVRVEAGAIASTRFGTDIDGYLVVALTSVVIGSLAVAFYRPLSPRPVLWGIVATLGAVVSLIALVDLWAIQVGSQRITRMTIRTTAHAQPGIYLTSAAGFVIFFGGIARLTAALRRRASTSQSGLGAA